MSISPKNEHLKALIERIVLFPVRVRHLQRAQKKRKARLDALRNVRHTLLGATQLKAGNSKTVFNVGLYILMLDQDIAFFTDDLVCAIGDNRRAFIVKQEAALLYEAAEDLPQLLGRDFRDAAKSLGASAEQLDRLNSVSSELNRFWQTHREFLGTIRNMLTAHRDHDSLRYLNTLDNLNPLVVMNIAVELSKNLELLAGVVTELSSLTVGQVALFKDVIVTSKKKHLGQGVAFYNNGKDRN